MFLDLTKITADAAASKAVRSGAPKTWNGTVKKYNPDTNIASVLLDGDTDASDAVVVGNFRPENGARVLVLLAPPSAAFVIGILTTAPEDEPTTGLHAATHTLGGTDVVTLAQSQITNLVSDLSAKAPLASPVFVPTAATLIGAVVKGAAAQTADLQQWQDSAGTPLTAISSVGDLRLAVAGQNASTGTNGVIRQTVAWDGSRPVLTVRNGAGTNNASLDIGLIGSYASNPLILLGSYDATFRGNFTDIVTIDNNVSANSAAAAVPLKIIGKSGQTGDLQQWRSPGAVLSYVRASDGAFTTANDVNLGVYGVYGTSRLGIYGATEVRLGTGAGGVITLTNTLNIDNIGNVRWAGTAPRFGGLTPMFIQPDSTVDTIPLIIRGTGVQSLDLQQWQNVGGTVKGRVSVQGQAVFTALSVGVAPDLNVGTQTAMIQANNPGASALVLRQPTAPTGNIFEAQDSNQNVLMSISVAGDLILRANPTAALGAATKQYVDSTAGAGAADATTTSKGIVQLAGDLSGTAAAPTVPGLANKQPLDTDLTAIAALVSAADKVPFSTGAGTWEMTNFTPYGRTLMNQSFASTARTTLELGNSATRNVGTLINTVAAGDDARFTNARTPTAHAATHNAGGADVISVTDAVVAAGAAIAQSKIANLTSDLAAKEVTANKGVANGYAALGASATVPLTQLATGTATASLFLRGDGTWAAVPAAGDPAMGGDLTGTASAAQIVAGVIVNADINAAAAIAESKLALASDAAAGVASRRTIGTGALQATAGNDARLSDARNPIALSVTNASVSATAAIAQSKLALTGPFAPTRTGAAAVGAYVGVTTAGAPTTGTHAVGDWVSDQAGKRFTCTVAGTPGTWVQEPGTAGSPADATTTSKGVVQLAGDLAGTAIAPTVPALANKQNTSALNAANGYAGLDGAAKVGPAQIPFGSLVNTVAQGNGPFISTAAIAETEAGVMGTRIGVVAGSPRIILEDPTAAAGSRIWEMDNSAGVLRFFMPGALKATLSNAGRLDLSIVAATTAVGAVRHESADFTGPYIGTNAAAGTGSVELVNRNNTANSVVRVLGIAGQTGDIIQVFHDGATLGMTVNSAGAVHARKGLYSDGPVNGNTGLGFVHATGLFPGTPKIIIDVPSDQTADMMTFKKAGAVKSFIDKDGVFNGPLSKVTGTEDTANWDNNVVSTTFTPQQETGVLEVGGSSVSGTMTNNGNGIPYANGDMIMPKAGEVTVEITVVVQGAASGTGEWKINLYKDGVLKTQSIYVATNTFSYQLTMLKTLAVAAGTVLNPKLSWGHSASLNGTLKGNTGGISSHMLVRYNHIH